MFQPVLAIIRFFIRNTRITHNTTKAEHTQNEEKNTHTHQQYRTTGHIRSTKRDKTKKRSHAHTNNKKQLDTLEIPKGM